MIAQDIRQKYAVTIGIETHVQLKTNTKLFAAVGNDAREAAPNTLVSHICFGLPGALPVLNEEAVRLAVKAAYALGTEPARFSKFDRKHYFYPDLPKGYQISQYDQPIITSGSVEALISDEAASTERTFTIGITRAHLEEDAGKSTHPEGKNYSLVDLNRAGTPLLEIVSEPQIHSSQEAKAYVRELYLLMKYAGVSDCDLYLGHMRFDVNVSVSNDQNRLGTRTETKNLNSFRSVEKAIEFEISRQIELLEKGQEVIQETRGWDEAKQRTFVQRSKEEAHDYRYMPDPDLPPIELDESLQEEIRATLPELPNAIRGRMAKLGLDRRVIETLLEADSAAAGGNYILKLSDIADPTAVRFAANWIVNRRLSTLQKQADADVVSTSTQAVPTALQFEAVHGMYEAKRLSSNSADALLLDLCAFPEDSDVAAIAAERGYMQSTDELEISRIVTMVLNENQKAALDIKNGEMKAIGFLVGQVMKASKGSASPQIAQDVIKKQLGI